MRQIDIIKWAMELRQVSVPLERIRLAVTEDEWKEMRQELGKSMMYLSPDTGMGPAKRIIIYGVELVIV